ncbi:hypothetical protein B0H13DRAFT_1883044 [Mycena leptocephala]|nr:hypothetical protein B0H13DRAFT_1883044 [Mycena leptocephala]
MSHTYHHNVQNRFKFKFAALGAILGVSSRRALAVSRLRPSSALSPAGDKTGKIGRMEYEIRDGWCGREGGDEGGGGGGGAAEDLEEGKGEGGTREVGLPFCGQLQNIRDGLGFGGGGEGHWEMLGDFWRWNYGIRNLTKNRERVSTTLTHRMRRCRKMIRFRSEKGEAEEVLDQAPYIYILANGDLRPVEERKFRASQTRLSGDIGFLQRLSCNNVTISSGVKRFTRNRKNEERAKSVVTQRVWPPAFRTSLLIFNVLAIEYDWAALTEHKLKEDSSPRALPGMIWNATIRSSLFTPYYELEIVPVSGNEDVRAVEETRRDQGSIQCKTLYLIWSKDLRASALLSTYS